MLYTASRNTKAGSMSEKPFITTKRSTRQLQVQSKIAKVWSGNQNAQRGRPTLPGTIWHSEHHAIIDLDHKGAYSHGNSFREFMARHIQ